MADTTLAQRMTKIVNDSGLTKVAFAKSVGVTRNYLHALLSGKSAKTSPTLAILIEKLYGYPAEWVLTGEVPSDHSMKNIADRIQELDKEEMQKVSVFLDKLKGRDTEL